MNKTTVISLGAAVTFLSALFVFYLRNNFSTNTLLENSNSETREVLGSPSLGKDVLLTEIIFNEEKYKMTSLKVESAENIRLGSNLTEKLSSNELFKQINCSVLISGGFYTKEYTPVGFFVEEGNLSKNFLTNDLFDGVFSINFSLTPRITREVPKDDLKYAIQSGPILIENAKAQNLSIRNDKPERRVVAAITGDNQVIYMIIYKETSKLIGPFLAELPEVLRLWQNKTGILLADAINLDGGSASAFISEEFRLTESSLLGSYFCIKN